MNYRNLCNYIFELGALKKIRHSGTLLAGISQPDSVAEHVCRASIIGHILARMEKADAAKTVLICLTHDNAEARITDLHKVARGYIDSHKAEMKACEDQSTRLPMEIGDEFIKCFEEFEGHTTKEAIVARDADMLETAFQAKEYLDCGYKACQDWINNVEKCVKTKSAKKILKEMKKTGFAEWFKNLKMPNY